MPELFDGIGFMPVAIGMFGLADIIHALASPNHRPARAHVDRTNAGTAGRITPRGLVDSTRHIARFDSRRSAWRRSTDRVVRVIAVETKVASAVPPVGSGAIEGVAGPESANNAAAQTSFIPLLTLGLPSNAVMALLLGALIVHGINPGPAILSQEPALFWGLVASMWIGNLMLLALNLPLVGLWATIATRAVCDSAIPRPWCCRVSASIRLNHSTFDLWMTAAFAVAGYLLKLRGFEPAPLLLAFVLSRPLEDNLRRALVFSDGDLSVFLREPMSAVLIAIAAGACCDGIASDSTATSAPAVVARFMNHAAYLVVDRHHHRTRPEMPIDPRSARILMPTAPKQPGLTISLRRVRRMAYNTRRTQNGGT